MAPPTAAFVAGFRADPSLPLLAAGAPITILPGSGAARRCRTRGLPL